NHFFNGKRVAILEDIFASFYLLMIVRKRDPEGIWYSLRLYVKGERRVPLTKGENCFTADAATTA
ncbi:hypothetical protein, partial [Cronobacter sakazakii]|uniref:hypothetical protein n=1 Tax=Cronobacter sakazakii TaxID=28141 RepID=UPI002116397C